MSRPALSKYVGPRSYLPMSLPPEQLVNSLGDDLDFTDFDVPDASHRHTEHIEKWNAHGES